MAFLRSCILFGLVVCQLVIGRANEYNDLGSGLDADNPGDTNTDSSINPNRKWEFKYTNTSNIPQDDWRWYSTSTGSKRVCNTGEFNDDPETPHVCLENRLEKKPVILSAGSNWGSTYIVW